MSGRSSPGTPIRIVFVIRALTHGGAERQLVELAKHIDRHLFDVQIVCLYPGGPLWDEAQSHRDLRMVSLGKKGRWDFGALGRLWSHLRELRPDIVHGYMDSGNLLALAAKPLGAKVVWGIRASWLDMSQYGRARRILRRLEGFLARMPDLIICNSFAGEANLVARGFPMRRVMVIPNGIDTERFVPNPARRQEIRAEWGVLPEHYLIGLVARMDPIKGHSEFLTAAELISRRYMDARFVIVGDGPESHRLSIEKITRERGLEGKVFWAGERSDMPAVLSALDLSVSASRGEGFSNVLAESMACGIPCVATDVGDATRIVGDLGWVVEPGNAVALAEGIIKARQAHREGKIDACLVRERIQREFSLDKLSKRTASALLSLTHC